MKMIRTINPNEDFPHLSKAPIVEAVIDIRIVAPGTCDENILQNELKNKLPDYPKVEQLRGAMYQFNAAEVKSPKIEDLGCVGLRLGAKDAPHIAQFNKTAFVFSRLKPYENWQKFTQEAYRLLSIYYQLLRPTEVVRIGLRFINRISVEQERMEFADYYKYPPETLKELSWPLGGHLHHDVIQVPGTSYSVNLIKTVQNIPGNIALILDIDVFTQNQFEYNEAQIKETLNEMRWIKNKIFFNSLTSKAMKEMK